MPLYVYTCTSCDSRTEATRSVSERHVGPACTVCGRTMKLVIQAVAGIVKNPAVPRSKR